MNIAHFIDHYSMLIFAAAIIVIAPDFETNYSNLLAYATPGFIAFGAGSLLSGWLGDKWSRRHMMTVFFIGMGISLIGVSIADTPLQIGIALFFVGLIASIYHPVGTSLLVANVDQLGREMGVNGMWGNFGVASSALNNWSYQSVFWLALCLFTPRIIMLYHRPPFY
jgi:MFS family permease